MTKQRRKQNGEDEMVKFSRTYGLLTYSLLFMYLKYYFFIYNLSSSNRFGLELFYIVFLTRALKYHLGVGVGSLSTTTWSLASNYWGKICLLFPMESTNILTILRYALP